MTDWATGSRSARRHRTLRQSLLDPGYTPAQLVGPFLRTALEADLDHEITGYQRVDNDGEGIYWAVAPLAGRVVGIVAGTYNVGDITGTLSAYAVTGTYPEGVYTEDLSDPLVLSAEGVEKSQMLATPLEFEAGAEILVQVSTSGTFSSADDQVSVHLLVEWVSPLPAAGTAVTVDEH